MSVFMKKRTRVFCELVCLILALALTLGSFTVFADETEATETVADEVQVVRFVKDAPQGTRLTEEYLETVTIKNVNVPANVVGKIEDAMRMYVVENRYAGEYLLTDHLSESYVASANEDLLVKMISKNKDDYVIVTDYVKANTGENLSSFLQEIIDKNPNRCIYFPAGEYVIAEPLQTSSNPKASVSILLDDGAVIKASDDWKGSGDNALICLGGTEMVNDIQSVGSYYTLMGGVFDGNGKANGIAMSAGRESVVRNVCIKNAKIGISIPRATNNTSSDLDFEDITIIGNGRPGSIGIDNHANDNTYTNIRIYDMAIGGSKLGGEIKSIYVINTEKSAAIAKNTVGLIGTGRITQCYTENCAIGFDLTSNPSTFNDCISVWTSDKWTEQTMFNKRSADFQVSGCRALFLKGEGITNTLVKDSSGKGTAYLECCIANITSNILPENVDGTAIIDTNK